METCNLLIKADMIKIKLIDKLRTDYFLQLLFNNLEKKKLLDIVKYNKNIKNRINIYINDYKEYAEKYSSIEIEIKPINNKYINQFININNEDEQYYHIYFNNNKNEIKRNYIKEDEKIHIIKIIIDYQVNSFENLFNDCKNIESIYFKKFYRNNINNMLGMLSGCSSLKELNLDNFKSNNVKNMGCIFYK